MGCRVRDGEWERKSPPGSVGDADACSSERDHVFVRVCLASRESEKASRERERVQLYRELDEVRAGKERVC